MEGLTVNVAIMRLVKYVVSTKDPKSQAPTMVFAPEAILNILDPEVEADIILSPRRRAECIYLINRRCGKPTINLKLRQKIYKV